MIVFRLPSWNTEVEVYEVVIGTAGNLHTATLTGQLYFPRRTAHGGDKWMYLLFPKEDWLKLNKPHYNTIAVHETPYNVVRIEWPTGSGSFKYYNVMNVQPRWLGFTNEHLCAWLDVLEDDDVALHFGPPGPPPGDPLSAGLSTLVASPAEVPADGISTTTLTLTLRRESGATAAGESGFWDASGDAVLEDLGFTTNIAGAAVTTATNTTVENTTFAANPDNLDVDITSNIVAWDGEPPPGGELTVPFIADGTCDDCSAASGNFPMNVVTPMADWASDPFSMPCTAGGDAKWSVSYSSGTTTIIASLAPAGGGGSQAVYIADTTSWDESSPITLDFSSGTGNCDWPATVEFVPVV